MLKWKFKLHKASFSLFCRFVTPVNWIRALQGILFDRRFRDGGRSFSTVSMNPIALSFLMCSRRASAKPGYLEVIKLANRLNTFFGSGSRPSKPCALASSRANKNCSCKSSFVFGNCSKKASTPLELNCPEDGDLPNWLDETTLFNVDGGMSIGAERAAGREIRRLAKTWSFMGFLVWSLCKRRLPVSEKRISSKFLSTRVCANFVGMRQCECLVSIFMLPRGRWSAPLKKAVLWVHSKSSYVHLLLLWRQSRFFPLGFILLLSNEGSQRTRISFKWILKFL